MSSRQQTDDNYLSHCQHTNENSCPYTVPHDFFLVGNVPWSLSCLLYILSNEEILEENKNLINIIHEFQISYDLLGHFSSYRLTISNRTIYRIIWWTIPWKMSIITKFLRSSFTAVKWLRFCVLAVDIHVSNMSMITSITTIYSCGKWSMLWFFDISNTYLELCVLFELNTAKWITDSLFRIIGCRYWIIRWAYWLLMVLIPK